MQPHDLGRVVDVGDPVVAPDGGTTAVVVSRPDVEANRTRSAIWLVDTASGRASPLTAGREIDGHPRWSSDGTHLAFTRTTTTATEPNTTSVLVMPAAGPGEPIVVDTVPAEVTDLDWSPDGTRLVWCCRQPEVAPGTRDRDHPPRRIATLRSTLDDEGWTVDRRLHAFVADVDGSAPTRAVTAGPYDHSGSRWSPDGTTLVVAAARHDGWDLDEVLDLWLVDPDPPGGEAAPPRRLTDGTRHWSHPSWSPDGRRIAALEQDANDGWRNTRPVVIDAHTGERTTLAAGIDRTFAPHPGERPPIWVDDTTVVVACEDRGRVVVHRLATDPAAQPEPITSGDQVVTGYDFSGGVLAVVVTDHGRPGELEVGPSPGGGPHPSAHRSTFTADFVAACPPAPAQRFAVPSPAGDGDIDCWLLTPSGWDEGDRHRWPLLLVVHGGPMAQFGERWFDEFQLLTGAGFAVLAGNPHGSSGREETWQRMLRSPKAVLDPGTGWGGIDADDLLATLDATLERWPAIDPARVGVLGGSYGGFMTTWLLARTDRFAAGCSERAVNNLLSEEWSSDEGGHFCRELGVSHLDDPGEYQRMSPVTYVRGITAPVLILHSEQDLRCHPEQADALFTALRLLGHPDVEYWRFPGEGHELSRSGSPMHRIRRAEIINAFFERTIGGGPR